MFDRSAPNFTRLERSTRTLRISLFRYVIRTVFYSIVLHVVIAIKYYCVSVAAFEFASFICDRT